MLSQLDFIRSYNHTLSSTFSHPSLPLTHHSRNRSLCSSVIPLPTAPNALALSPDETLLAVAAGSDVLIYSTGDNMNLTYTLQGHAGQVTSVEWYPNGEKKLVSGSSVDGTHQEEVVWFWDLNKEDSPTEAKIDLECTATGAECTATGARAVAAEPLVLQAGRISNQDSGSQAQPSFLTSSQRACVFKKDGSAQPRDGHRKPALSASLEIDLEDIAARATATAAEALISEAGWTSTEISATGLQRLIFEALREARVKHTILRHLAFPGRLAGFGSSSFSPDGESVFYLPTRTTVAVLSASTVSEKFLLEGHTDAIMWIGASPDSKLLATSSWDQTVKIWDLQDGSLLKTLRGTRGQNWSGSWSPDGKLIAVGSGDKTVRVWDVLSGDTVHVLGDSGNMFSGWVRGLAFDAADGHSLVASSWGGTVRVFDMGSGECTNLYQINPVASSPHGRLAEGFMEISDTLKYAPTSSTRFGFTPPGGRLVVYDTGRNKMWEFIQDRKGSDRTSNGSGTFLFAKNGERVYSGDTDGVVRVWDLD